MSAEASSFPTYTIVADDLPQAINEFVNEIMQYVHKGQSFCFYTHVADNGNWEIGFPGQKGKYASIVNRDAYLDCKAVHVFITPDSSPHCVKVKIGFWLVLEDEFRKRIAGECKGELPPYPMYWQVFRPTDRKIQLLLTWNDPEKGASTYSTAFHIEEHESTFPPESAMEPAQKSAPMANANPRQGVTEPKDVAASANNRQNRFSSLHDLFSQYDPPETRLPARRSSLNTQLIRVRSLIKSMALTQPTPVHSMIFSEELMETLSAICMYMELHKETQAQMEKDLASARKEIGTLKYLLAGNRSPSPLRASPFGAGPVDLARLSLEAPPLRHGVLILPCVRVRDACLFVCALEIGSLCCRIVLYLTDFYYIAGLTSRPLVKKTKKIKKLLSERRNARESVKRLSFFIAPLLDA
ncbi:MAG: hypothetical protein ABW189_05705 [Rickettsiales bacterium]